MSNVGRSIRARAAAAIICGASGLAGCTSIPPIVAPMRQVPRLELGAPDDKARVVFVRPSAAFGSDNLVQIDDGTSETLAFLANAAAVAVDLAPGSHELCASFHADSTFVPGVVAGFNTTSAAGQFSGVLMLATLEAGKTYVVGVDLVSHMMTPATADLLGARPGSTLWSELVDGLPKLRAVMTEGEIPQPNGGALEACRRGREAASPERVAEATLEPAHGTEL